MEYPCDDCENYEFDEESEACVCVMDLDMDEFERYVLASDASGRIRCPYYRVRDDYRVVRRQN